MRSVDTVRCGGGGRGVSEAQAVDDQGNRRIGDGMEVRKQNELGLMLMRCHGDEYSECRSNRSASMDGRYAACARGVLLGSSLVESNYPMK